MIFNYLLILFVGVVLGGLLKSWSLKLSEKIAHNKLILDRNKQFKEILEKSKTKKTRFKTRINNVVYIGVKLADYGRVDVVLFLDKRDISIFRENKCIITSDLVESSLLKELIETLETVHYHKIIDTVEILGMVFSREDFEKQFNVNFDEIKEKTNRMMDAMRNGGEELSDIDKIINKNKSKLDIDDILDKINKVGIENLTKEEKDFLNNYNK
jgi:hypothetical protein